ncbi:hypothetical protein PISMIDRAFT_682619 [Pisolithus microcarpus 441]|uniref:Uncharacterized protein n=1 Tax=Pisolithus microcarpus 441 TaxID=765257 RepID=A0A0C9ZCG2_9AGAM|nr:hypothetical protein PISMIDRAFT_682619 [Pisolithus microcarpus 441]
MRSITSHGVPYAIPRDKRMVTSGALSTPYRVLRANNRADAVSARAGTVQGNAGRGTSPPKISHHVIIWCRHLDHRVF